MTLGAILLEIFFSSTFGLGTHIQTESDAYEPTMHWHRWAQQVLWETLYISPGDALSKSIKWVLSTKTSPLGNLIYQSWRCQVYYRNSIAISVELCVVSTDDRLQHLRIMPIFECFQILGY